MIQQYLGISPDKLIKAGWETLYMVGFSLIIGSIVGFFIAIVLWLTRKGGLKENSSTSSEAHRLSSFWYV